MENRTVDFMGLAAARYSVRRFAARPVPRETMGEILRAGMLAPTACNLQPQRLLVIDSPDGLARLRKCTMSHFDAPAAVLVCADQAVCWKREYDNQPSGAIDASIVCTHMMLAAWALGVGTTWVMHFIPEAVREEFGVPPDYEPVALLVMGYPHAEAKPYPAHAKRREASEVTAYNHF